MLRIFKNLFDSNEKQLKKIHPIIDTINSFEEEISKLTDEQLKSKTDEFRERLGLAKEDCREEFSTLNEVELKKKLDEEKTKLYEILPEVFAVVREASKRVAQHRHFDVQLMAGYVLFDNRVSELFTCLLYTSRCV